MIQRRNQTNNWLANIPHLMVKQNFGCSFGIHAMLITAFASQAQLGQSGITREACSDHLRRSSPQLSCNRPLPPAQQRTVIRQTTIPGCFTGSQQHNLGGIGMPATETAERRWCVTNALPLELKKIRLIIIKLGLLHRFGAIQARILRMRRLHTHVHSDKGSLMCSSGENVRWTQVWC